MAELPGPDKPVVEVLGRELVAEHIGWHAEALERVGGERTHVVGVLKAITHATNSENDVVTVMRLAVSGDSFVDITVDWRESVAIGADTESLLRYAVESMSGD